MILHDLHLHTQYSDGRNSVADMIHAAVAVGLKWIGFTDHYDRVCGRLNRQKAEIAQAPHAGRIHILRSAEVRIMPDGVLPITDEVAATLDYILLEPNMPALRQVRGGKRKQISAGINMLLRSAQRQHGAIYAHPFNFGRLCENIAPRDLDRKHIRELAQAFAAHDHIFEIMNNIWYWYPMMPPERFFEEYMEIIAIFAEAGVKFSLGSDAHSLCGVGNLGWSLKMVRACGVATQVIRPEIFCRAI